jgi:cell wall-associated NlpC family hydrolase
VISHTRETNNSGGVPLKKKAFIQAPAAIGVLSSTLSIVMIFTCLGAEAPSPAPASHTDTPAARAEIQSANTSQDSIRESIVQSALSLVGTPYRYGGSTLSGFDCCGFVMYVYARNGIRLPRTSRDQFSAGKKIEMKDIKKGDLLFYKLSGDTVSHVGIYIGDRYFVHSPVPGSRVRSERIDSEYWTKHFAGAAAFL